MLGWGRALDLARGSARPVRRGRDLGHDDWAGGGDPGLINNGEILLGREVVRHLARPGARVLAIAGSQLGTSGATRI